MLGTDPDRLRVGVDGIGHLVDVLSPITDHRSPITDHRSPITDITRL